MNHEPDRYELVYNPVTEQPLGITDLWQPGATSIVGAAFRADQRPEEGLVYQPVFAPMPVQMPVHGRRVIRSRTPGEIRARLYLWAAAGIFAAGLAMGCMLFGGREAPAPVVMVCTPASSYPFTPAANAAAPAQCATQSPGVAR
ncbi:hypothetical protein KO481_33530 [Nocardia sp. NEAU-G5]|uniref:Uncharacterized protein n=1 Tax=Nocardia albiluteola TaxID=2842303 RepID=A0ABS6BAH5_9NOCA|nr:hypothetical protein [Nocardia albiluteola]MBU3066431.1 hypothetical protein [Nocardia albiluteola]